MMSAPPDSAWVQSWLASSAAALPSHACGPCASIARAHALATCCSQLPISLDSDTVAAQSATAAAAAADNSKAEAESCGRCGAACHALPPFVSLELFLEAVLPCLTPDTSPSDTLAILALLHMVGHLEFYTEHHLWDRIAHCFWFADPSRHRAQILVHATSHFYDSPSCWAGAREYFPLPERSPLLFDAATVCYLFDLLEADQTSEETALSVIILLACPPFRPPLLLQMLSHPHAETDTRSPYLPLFQLLLFSYFDRNPDEEARVADTSGPNPILNLLADRVPQRSCVFSEQLAMYYSRGTDGDIHQGGDPLFSLMVARFAGALHADPASDPAARRTCNFFYPADLRVVIDCALRELHNLPADEPTLRSLRRAHLTFLANVLAREEVYRATGDHSRARIEEYVRGVASVAGPGGPVDRRFAALAGRVSELLGGIDPSHIT
ncbi:hypothetical protein H696_02805 [Fonticula alba]|uniref:SPIN90/Ldb17 leucine-rich domain-containing protein n=1 Tax=Fonticula alba TaxID=691883 RepID=A0A058Z870_FONAL|nr:hypothetical protein H696_02805 [Fonticula alba]KCV70464.1 hypothetical protein H696_02805 [Fonticula alba]|eukprot:XP_009494980.1 hypothetical protein H696_02805 [Fonticula alba]